LSNIRARDVVGTATEEEAGARGLGDAAERASITLSDGSVKTLLFGGKVEGADDLLYFQVDGETLVWSLPKYLRDNVFKNPDDLKPE
jgi:hypothetical protein